MSCGPRCSRELTYPAEKPLHALRPPSGFPKSLLIVAVYPPTTNSPPTAGSVTSVKAPPLILGEEISRTPPSKNSPPPLSRLYLFLKATEGAKELTRRNVSSVRSLTTTGALTKASFGAVSGLLVSVTQKLLAQPGGRAGAVTLSKFSAAFLHGIGEGVEKGVAVGEGEAGGVAVGVAVGVGGGGGLGDGAHSGMGPGTDTVTKSAVLKKPIVPVPFIGAPPSNRKL